MHDLPGFLAVSAEPGAEVCPAKPELGARVEAILHRRLETETARPELAVDVRFRRGPDGTFVATVTTRGRKPGQRVLRDTDPTCSALGDAVSVAIALLLDSAPDEEEAEGENEEAPPSTPVAKTGATGADAPVVPVRARVRPWEARAQLEAGGSYGLGAHGSLVAFGRLGARHGSWLVDLGVGGNVPTHRQFRGGGVETSLLFGSLRTCYLVGHSFALGACVALGAGRLLGVGTGYPVQQRSSLPWTAAGGGLVAEATLGTWVFLSLEASLWVPSRRQTFSVDNAGIAWESKPLAGALTAGFGIVPF